MNVSLTDSLADGGVVVGLARKPPPSPGTPKDEMTTINAPAAITLHEGMSENDCGARLLVMIEIVEFAVGRAGGECEV